MSSLSGSPTVVIHGQAGPDAGLVPGRDLVVEPWPSRQLPEGVLLDDWLSPTVRREIDTEARRRFQTFASGLSGALTIEGLSLTHVWDVELIAEVFLWETRIVRGLHHALQSMSATRIEWHGLDDDLVTCLERILNREGARVGTGAPARRYPSDFGSSRRPGVRSRALTGLLRTIGVPPWARGDVLMWPYWNLTPVFLSATARRGFAAVIDPQRLPPVRSDLLRVVREGGWIGQPGAAARRRSRAAVHRHLRAVAAIATTTHDPLDELLARRAIVMLDQMAGETLADLSSLRAAFRGRSLRASVIPYDVPPAARILLHAANEAGVPTLMLQHGLASEPDLLQEGTVADVVAVWSRQEIRNLEGRARGRVELTGNPGVESRLDKRPERRPASRGRTLVLLEYPSRVSARIDARAKLRHLEVALAALAVARPGAEVIVRPHPSDHEPDMAARVVADHPSLHAEVDVARPFEEALSAVDLVIGSTSTATLEAAAAEVPVVYLDVARAGFAPPFDGSSVLPAASEQAELAHTIADVLAGRQSADVRAAREVLGMRSGSTGRVVELINDMVSYAP